MTFPARGEVQGTGSGVYAQSLLKELQERNDLQMREICGPTTGGPFRTLRWLASGARDRLRAEAVDVLHCPAFVTPWRSPVPFVITMHDAAAFHYPHDFPREWGWYNRRVLPGLARRAARIIAPSDFGRQEIIRHYGARPDRVVVTPLAPSAEYRVQPEQHVCGMRSRLGSDDPLLLFSGAPTRRKNFDVLLKAMSLGPPGGPARRARLVVTGASEDGFPHYRARIRSLGLADRVRWLGRIPREQLPLIYAAADILVYPSMYEGFGLPPLEAMSVGTPVVASNSSCLPEVLGDAALLVDPTDEKEMMEGIEAILTRQDLRESLSRRGSSRAKQYSWSRCARETVQVYEDVRRDASQARSKPPHSMPIEQSRQA